LHPVLRASANALDNEKYAGEENQRYKYVGESLFESHHSGGSLARNRGSVRGAGCWDCEVHECHIDRHGVGLPLLQPGPATGRALTESPDGFGEPMRPGGHAFFHLQLIETFLGLGTPQGWISGVA
jgi:hypothetical protein